MWNTGFKRASANHLHHFEEADGAQHHEVTFLKFLYKERGGMMGTVERKREGKKESWAEEGEGNQARRKRKCFS